MSEALVLFVEKAHKLETSSFWCWLKGKRGPSDMERIITGDWLAHDGLNIESLDSFCLTLRLLIQDQDGFSIRKIVAIAKSWPDAHADIRNEIILAAARLRHELNQRCLVQLPDPAIITNQDLFDVIFYGGLAHANPVKRDLFRTLTKAGLFSYFVFQAFVSVLFSYRNCIQVMAYNIVLYMSRQD